jgi:hypothetical protein
MKRIIIGPHTSIYIRPNNSLDLSVFSIKGVLIILPNKQASQASQVSYDS